MKEIPLFSVPQLNSFEEYVRFQHCAAYIRAKSARFPDRFKEDEQRLLPLMRAVGYKKLDRFRMHRRQWDRLERDVPKSYLAYLGIDAEMLEYCNSLDYLLFEQAKGLPLYPKAGIVRLMPTVYIPYRFPEGTPEAEAIEMLREYAVARGRHCVINYPDFKSIPINPEGGCGELFFPPEISWSAHRLKVGRDGRGVGTTRLR
jgi:hypothetical protein